MSEMEVYEMFCTKCACEAMCHESCDYCDEVLEALEKMGEVDG